MSYCVVLKGDGNIKKKAEHAVGGRGVIGTGIRAIGVAKGWPIHTPQSWGGRESRRVSSLGHSMSSCVSMLDMRVPNLARGPNRPHI